jgi:ABC-2 type transport system ATP-binding protein
VVTRDEDSIGEGVVASGLVKSYGPIEAVKGIDLRVEPGETIAVLGPNGAGKTTTIDMLLGLTRPDAGRVALFGKAPVDAVASGMVAAMAQTGSLMRDLSVAELVAMVASLYPHPLPVQEAMRVADLTGLAGRRTHRLSGGQAQRVRFALALVANAPLMVLDEPTAALDPNARREFWAVMRHAAAAGKTVIFATHYLDEADAFADRIVVLAGGRVAADGTTTAVRAAVQGRTVRATLPDVSVEALQALAGVISAQRRGDSVELRCADADSVLCDLLGRYPEVRDIEVRVAGLEEAFVELTDPGHDHGDHLGGATVPTVRNGGQS